MASFVPQDLGFAETAPIIFQSIGVVAGTPQEVWDTILDYERWPQWFTSVKTCRATSDPATGVGSTRVVTIAGGAAIVEEFIAWDEPKVWAFTGLEGPPIFQSLVERVTLVELGPNLTEVTYRMAIEPRRGLGPFVKLARGGIEKNLKVALRNLNQAVGARRPPVVDEPVIAPPAAAPNAGDDDGHDEAHDHPHPHPHTD